MAPIIREKRLLVGLFLILIGAVLVLDKIHLFYLPGWVFSWPSIFVLIGIFSLLTNDRPVPGIIFLAIGGFFLMDDIFYDFSFYFYRFWPIAFIIAGIFVIVSISRRHQSRDRDKRWSGSSGTKADTSDASSVGDDFIDEVAIFGGGVRTVISDNFKGGKMTAIFGGSELDLTNAELAEGVNYLEVVAMFGGWELHVPAHWNIEVKVTPIFGGWDDKRRVVTGDPVDNTRKLVIRGTVVFGGGEINNHIIRK